MNIIEAFNVLNLSHSSASQAEIKKAYKQSSLKYHPDRNPAGTQIMQAVNSAYDFLSNLGIDSVQVNIVSESEINYYDFAEKLSVVLNDLIKLDGIDIEVCGNWVWISGETRQHKDIIKNLGCYWSKNKSMWYFRPEEYKRSYRKEKNIVEIRSTYGSKKVSTKKFYLANSAA